MLPSTLDAKRQRGSLHPDKKPELYKTEMCRNWTEMGHCRYGKKCRFAHGDQELRTVQRHARYKTEICRTYHMTGTCLYGVRCTFIHDENGRLSDDDSSTSSSSTITTEQSYHPRLTSPVSTPELLLDTIVDKKDKRLAAFSSICSSAHHHDNDSKPSPNWVAWQQHHSISSFYTSPNLAW
ncbi:hypothetical protein BJV82DRAFT_504938 [Fennellomyces sp. T-0311]|nr:hypothetical protein BJV82DRAFT_504938 [Fennellomyces sp. T-0311]